MSEIVLKGTRPNLAGLLRLMASELEQGEARSATCFSEVPGADPTMTLVCQVAPEQPYDTTLTVRP